MARLVEVCLVTESVPKLTTEKEKQMKKLMVYSHDTFGLGNIRRMLSICHHLLETIPDLSILLVTGSPMIHSFRLPARLDYIKLPCLSRTEYEGYTVKSLGTSMDETMQLRADLLLSAVMNFKPDLLLVDKKPYGVKRELEGVLRYVRFHQPATRQALILRDILDAPEATIQTWEKQNYYEAIDSFYDVVLALGAPEIFDLGNEYKFSATMQAKLKYCGYIQREPGTKIRCEIRKELALRDEEKLVLVTPGGGEDGYEILQNYLAGLALLPDNHNIHSVIISGPEMAASQRRRLVQAGLKHTSVITMLEFTDDLMSYMNAAEAVISMGGYNTICEILTLQKRAIVIPRSHPTQEQIIRAERMSSLGLFKTIHPDDLNPKRLMQELISELNSEKSAPRFALEALPGIADWVTALLPESTAVEPDRQNRRDNSKSFSMSALLQS